MKPVFEWSRAMLPIVLCACVHAANGQCTQEWIALPGGAHPNDWVYALQAWDVDGPGPQRTELIIGGNFSEPASYLGAWNGTEFRPVDGGTDGTVLSLGTYVPPNTNPMTPLLVAGGVFWHAGLNYVRPIALWDGAMWSGMPGLGHTSSTAPIWPYVHALTQHGTTLVASGNFNLINGQPSNRMGQWNGSTWSSFPDGQFSYDLHVHEDQLYSAGVYELPGSPPTRSGILRWTGADWVTVGAGFPPDCESLITWRGMLICGGWDLYQSPEWNNIAAWNGQQWLQFDAGTNGRVKALAVFDPDGAGPAPDHLIAAGGFTSASGVPASGIAAWDGSGWHALGTGVNGLVEALEVYDQQLYLGGRFTMAGGVPSPFLARWGCPQPAPCYANCDGSTVEPRLNIDDFTCFINEFAAGRSLPHAQQIGHYANCDGSTIAPVLNVDDFTCFINEFAAGCR